jgi:hypothetical protein
MHVVPLKVLDLNSFPPFLICMQLLLHDQLTTTYYIAIKHLFVAFVVEIYCIADAFLILALEQFDVWPSINW